MAINRQEAEAQFKENLLCCMAEAALGGHDLGEWMPVDGREQAFQAVCRRCGKSIYTSYQFIYSILENSCPINQHN